MKKFFFYFKVVSLAFIFIGELMRYKTSRKSKERQGASRKSNPLPPKLRKKGTSKNKQ